MPSVPGRRPIDRTKPPYRDDPVIAALTDDQVWALADMMTRFATSLARKLEAEGVTGNQLEAALRRASETGEHPRTALRAVIDAEPVATPDLPAPKPKRTRRPSPSKLAKWEAAWQAERDAEAES